MGVGENTYGHNKVENDSTALTPPEKDHRRNKVRIVQGNLPSRHTLSNHNWSARANFLLVERRWLSNGTLRLVNIVQSHLSYL